MSIQSDFVELKNYWRHSSFYMRAWLLIVGYLSISSIASISDTVFQWKGFFLDALLFYRNWISGPIRSFFWNVFGVHYAQRRVDTLVLMFLVVASYTRAYIFSPKRLKGESRSIHFVILLAAWIQLFMFLDYFRASEPQLDISSLVFILPILGASLIFSNEIRRGGFNRERTLRLIQIFSLQLLLALFVVGLLGAINHGLHK